MMGDWTRTELADLRHRTASLAAQVRAAQHHQADALAMAVPVVAAELAAGRIAHAAEAGYESGLEQQHDYDRQHLRELG